MTNGNGIKIKVLTAILVLTVLVGAILYTVDGIASANGKADRALERVNGIENRLDRMEAVQLRMDDKLDKVLLEVKR